MGSVSASDPDVGQTLTYAILSGNTSGAFAINPATGQITVANPAALGSSPSFALTVQVTDNGVPALSSTAVITINVTKVAVTAQQQINLLGANVQSLVSAGSLDKGQANALTASLNAATAKLSQGNTTAAVNTLNAFINKVQALIQSKNLSAANGQKLIDAAKAAIALIK